MIRDEPERNLFLECLQSINQPPTATDQPERRRSTRHSQSTPSPSTQTENPKGKEECQETLNQQSTRQSTRFPQSTTPSPSTHAERATRRNNPALLTDNQQQGRNGRFTVQTSQVNCENVNFGAWQDELRAGHTKHVQYHDWLSERTEDNRRLIREAAAVEEQNSGKRLLANSLAGWGNGLNRTTTTRVVMSKDKETSTQLQNVAGKSPSPAPAEEQQRNPMTSSERPLLSSLTPPAHLYLCVVLPGQYRSTAGSTAQKLILHSGCLPCFLYKTELDPLTV